MSQFAAVPKAPEDPILGLNVLYKADPSPNKVNLGVGAYRTDEHKPWILPAVHKAEQALLNDPSADHEYLPIDGSPAYQEGARKLILGDSAGADRVATVQSLSGTGALRVGFEFLRRFYVNKQGQTPAKIYFPNPTWGNHHNIARDTGIVFGEYRYFDSKTNGLDFKGMCEDIKNAPHGSIILLHACAHNPTGVDPTPQQWSELRELLKSCGHIPFFDCAYQGFASGSLAQDAEGLRSFVRDGSFDLLVAQSFAKNFGLYSERSGALHVVLRADGTQAVDAVRSQLKTIIRPMYSNPPGHGANVVTRVLSDPQLFAEWEDHLRDMSGRIKTMRHALFDLLKQNGTPGDWSHIVNQIGMFSYTGLNEGQCERLIKEFHIYLLKNGRISMAGLNTKNVKYVADAIHKVVVESKL
jgi:aspartate aminotransferase